MLGGAGTARWNEGKRFLKGNQGFWTHPRKKQVFCSKVTRGCFTQMQGINVPSKKKGDGFGQQQKVEWGHWGATKGIALRERPGKGGGVGRGGGM